jgi:hypothetical protein
MKPTALFVPRSARPGVEPEAGHRTLAPFLGMQPCLAVPRARRQIGPRPPILHPIALDAILGFRGSMRLIKAVSPCYVRVSEFDVLSADCGGTCENRCSEAVLFKKS